MKFLFIIDLLSFSSNRITSIATEEAVAPLTPLSLAQENAIFSENTKNEAEILALMHIDMGHDTMGDFPFIKEDKKMRKMWNQAKEIRVLYKPIVEYLYDNYLDPYYTQLLEALKYLTKLDNTFWDTLVRSHKTGSTECNIEYMDFVKCEPEEIYDLIKDPQINYARHLIIQKFIPFTKIYPEFDKQKFLCEKQKILNTVYNFMVFLTGVSEFEQGEGKAMQEALRMGLDYFNMFNVLKKICREYFAKIYDLLDIFSDFEESIDAATTYEELRTHENQLYQTLKQRDEVSFFETCYKFNRLQNRMRYLLKEKKNEEKKQPMPLTNIFFPHCVISSNEWGPLEK